MCLARSWNNALQRMRVHERTMRCHAAANTPYMLLQLFIHAVQTRNVICCCTMLLHGHRHVHSDPCNSRLRSFCQLFGSEHSCDRAWGCRERS